jgi:hypothetical protein
VVREADVTFYLDPIMPTLSSRKELRANISPLLLYGG